MFRSLHVAATGMAAQETKLDTIANNLANANTTRTAQGGPYRRQMVVYAPRGEQIQWMYPGIEPSAEFRGRGVRVAGVIADPSAFKQVYDPGHPDADTSGYVSMPNVNPASVMS